MSNKLQRKFAICCLIMILISPNSTVYAATVEQAGNGLANYCKSFVETTTQENSSVRTHYDLSYFNDRVFAYKDQENPNCTCARPSGNFKYLGMDCVGWVSYAIHHSLGLGEEEFTYFVTPQSLVQHNAFELLPYSGEGSAKPGDVLIAPSAPHVAIYVGDGRVVDGGLQYSLTSPALDNIQPSVIYRPVLSSTTYIARIKPEAAAEIKSIVDTYNGSAVSVSAGTGKAIDYGNFYFNGIPDGKYSLASRKNIFLILIESLAELVNFFTGLISYLFRGLIIGIISIFDRLINNTVQSINDSPKTLEESGVSATSADDPYSMNRYITIEGLVFNSLDLFDVNIFKVEDKVEN